MKHVELNVVSAALTTLNYTGVSAGFVAIVADDPGMHLSQDEQDTRNYAFFAKAPCLEPSNPMEVRELVCLAFSISEQFGTPVLVRSTPQLSYNRGEECLKALKSRVEGPSLNRIELRDRKMVRVKGQEVFPSIGEITPDVILEYLCPKKKQEFVDLNHFFIPRPPILCRLSTPGVFKTFIHAGISSLVDVMYNNNKTPITVLILDNGTTVMTGVGTIQERDEPLWEKRRIAWKLRNLLELLVFPLLQRSAPMTQRKLTNSWREQKTLPSLRSSSFRVCASSKSRNEQPLAFAFGKTAAEGVPSVWV